MKIREKQDRVLFCGSYCPRWFIVRTKWGEEKIAAERIKAQGFTVYLPEYVAAPVRGRSSKNKNEVIDDTGRIGRRLPLFPRYIFVNFDPTIDRWRPICSTKGVEKLFGATAETPTPVPFGVVEELLSRPEICAVLKPQDLTGMTLLIEDGAWSNFQGVCQWSTEKRVGVLMSVFGRSSQILDIARDKVKVL